MNEKCRLLITEVEKAFRKGIILSDDVCHFLNSTFSNPTLSELEAVINDTSNFEKDSFLELVFFPDEFLQIKVEDILSKEYFQEQDENILVDYFASTEPVAAVFVSGFERPLKIKMPGWSAEALVSRLKVLKQINQRLAKVVEKYIHTKEQSVVRVRLRNKEFKESKSKIDFLCEFFKQHATENVDFLKHLDFILQFFAETESDEIIDHSLMQKKQNYEEKIQQAIKFEEQLRKNNIETMMMQGKRNQCINVVDLQEKIDIINYLQNFKRAVHE
ncbi:MAG: hypothetical protein JRF40_08535 [Deltaproteobacteria bacterium]|nr:hypothetical protein [Deltaproteobacteria bacterium]MBW2219519.1 hypothetical protein [Deltaproteobacteria bacterium]